MALEHRPGLVVVEEIRLDGPEAARPGVPQIPQDPQIGDEDYNEPDHHGDGESAPSGRGGQLQGLLLLRLWGLFSRR